MEDGIINIYTMIITIENGAVYEQNFRDTII